MRAALAGLVPLACTVILDLLITVLAGRTGIRAWPVNLMYLLAWLVRLSGVMLAAS